MAARGGAARNPIAAVGGKDGFKNLVRLLVRVAYAGECPPKDAIDPETGQVPVLRNRIQKADTTGMAVVVVDYLTEQAWINEDVLAEKLLLSPKQVRRVVRYLEQEQLLMREHVREKKKAEPGDATTATAGGDDDDEEKPKVRTKSYCAIDYGRAYDATQLRLHKARRRLRDAAADSTPLQGYACPACGASFTSLDALHLLDPATGTFRCDNCSTELAQRFGAGGLGDDAQRRAHIAAQREMLQRAEEQLKPLSDQLARLKDMAPPDYGPLMEWAKEVKAQHAARGGRGPAHDAQGIPIFTVDLDTGLMEAREEEEAAAAAAAAAKPKMAVPWLQQGTGRGDAGPQGAAAPFIAIGGAGEGVKGEQQGPGADDKEGKGGSAEQQAYMQQFMAAMAQQAQAILTGGGGGGGTQAEAKPGVLLGAAGKFEAGTSPAEPEAKRRRTRAAAVATGASGWSAAVKLEDGGVVAAAVPVPTQQQQQGVAPGLAPPAAQAPAVAAAGVEGEGKGEEEMAWEEVGTAATDAATAPAAAQGGAAAAAGDEDELDWEEV